MSSTAEPLTMMQLKARFALRPLVPDKLLRQQAGWRQRWGMKPRPVHPESTNWAYHVDATRIIDPHPNDPWLRLRFSLLHDGPGTKYFLTGTKGAGKSTAINSLWLDEEVTARYALLGFSIGDYLNLSDADAGQVIAVMLAHVAEALLDVGGRDAALGIPEAKAVIKDLTKTLKKAMPGATLDGVDLRLFGLLTAKFKESTAARQEFRSFMDGRPEMVLDLLDRCVESLEKLARKPVLILIDELDKLTDPEVKQDVFQVRLPTLLRPKCAALYTFPLELVRNPRYDQLKARTNRFSLGNVKLFEDPSYARLFDPGVRLLRRFIECRLDDCPLDAYLDEAVFETVLRYSCGNFRELTRILQHAFQTAAMLECPRVDAEGVRHALSELRRDYSPFLKSYRGVLETVRHNLTADDKRDIDPESLSPLIQSLAIVEYPNDPGWDDVHPILRDLMQGRPSGP